MVLVTVLPILTNHTNLQDHLYHRQSGLSAGALAKAAILQESRHNPGVHIVAQMAAGVTRKQLSRSDNQDSIWATTNGQWLLAPNHYYASTLRMVGRPEAAAQAMRRCSRCHG